jgi:hypothetical protein
MTGRISITRWIVTMDNDMWFAPWNGDPSILQENTNA